MGIGIATHGKWCNARTYPLKCRHCGDEIFFFSCDHGSRVLFDKLGWPWPIHDCQNPNNIIRNVDLEIAEEYARLIAENERLRREREDEIPIKAVSAEVDETVRGFGTVREVMPIDIFHRYGFDPNNPIHVSALKGLVDTPLYQVTVHTGELGAQLLSYTFFVSRDMWNDWSPDQGDLISFQLVGRPLLARADYWWCVRLHMEDIF